MEHSQQQNQKDGENGQSFPEVNGRKLIKVEVESLDQQLDFRSIIYEKFDPQQVKSLIEHLTTLQNYYQFISFEIEHQDRSLSILSKSVLHTFPYLNNRVQQMVAKAKFNVAFLDTVLMPYKQIVVESILAEQQGEEGSEMYHTHACHHNNSAITNMFYHLVKEWAVNPEIEYVTKIIEYLEKYWAQGGQRTELSQQQNNRKILVVGSGMGRILHEIKSKYGENIEIQGHQSDTEKYLCGEYFLNRCSISQDVYPYLHSFNNFINNDDPYRCIKIPEVIDDHSYYYPLTLGRFQTLYKSHQQCWDVIITTFNSENISNILYYLQLVYKMLKQGGLWIDVTTSNFDSNIIKFAYRQYESILNNSQFKLLEKNKVESDWYGDTNCLMNERRVNYYRVMRK